MLQDRLQAIRDLIAASDIEAAINVFQEAARGTRYADELTFQSGRFQELKRQQLRGTLDRRDYEVRWNQITQALLELLNEMKRDAVAGQSLPPSDIPSSGIDGPPPVGPVFSGTGDGDKPVTTGTGDGRLPSKTPFWFSVAAFAVLLSISLFVPNWEERSPELFKTLLALAAAGVAATLPGFLSLEWSGVLKAGGALAAFVLVYFVNPAGKTEPFTLTVNVRAAAPSANYPTLHGADLWLWHRNDWQKRTLSPEGLADFKNLDYKPGDRVPVELHAAFYRLQADSLTVQLPSTLVTAVPDGSLGQVNGSVQDAQGKSLPGAVVRVEGMADTTDAFGLFQIAIPPDKQREKYRLIAEKTGYERWENFFSPTKGGQEAPIVLQKRKK